MQTVYTAKVAIAAPPVSFEHLYKFGTKEERDAFVEKVKETSNVKVIATSIDHLLTVTEAFEDCTDPRWVAFA